MEKKNVRQERMTEVCQILANWYDYEQQPHKARTFRHAMVHDQPLKYLPSWAYRKAVSLLEELQRDAEEGIQEP